MGDVIRNEKSTILRGDVWFVEKFSSSGSEQNSGRPAVIVSNDMNNACSTVVEVVYLTTQPKTDLPTHVTIRSLGKPSTALCEQITAVYVDRLGNYYGHVSDEELSRIDTAMQVCLGLNTYNTSEAPKTVIDPNPAMVEDLTAAHKEIDRLQKLVDELMTERSTQTNTNIDLNDDIEKLKLTIGELTEEIEEKDQQILDMQGENVDLSGRLDVACHEKDELLVQYHKLTEQFDALTKKSAEISMELAKFKNREKPYPAYEEHLRKAENTANVFKAKFELMRELYTELVAITACSGSEGGG